MPAVTAAQRSKMYLALACVMVIVLILIVTAAAMPLWSETSNSSEGLWSQCDKGTGGWIQRTCVELKKSTPCDGWYQCARICALIGIAFTVLTVCLAIACAMQAVITKMLPALCMCFAFFAMLMLALAWIAWLAYRGQGCTNTDGTMLGPSFILQVVAWCLAFLAMCLAIYLFISDILVPAGPEMAKDVPAFDYPVVAAQTPVYY